MNIIRVLVFSATMAHASLAVSDEFGAEQELRIKALALEAILERPEIVREAIAILHQREEADKSTHLLGILESRRGDLERDPNAPVLGNPAGDVTVVEFFDYNCPYCKKAVDVIRELVSVDENIRLVYRELPVLGQGSEFAARAALAARRQGKYEEMHWALMSLPRATEASVQRTAQDLGLDMVQLEADMLAPEISAHFALSMDLARALGFTGTPSFVVGNQLAPGLVPLDKLVNYVSRARQAR